MIDAVQVYEGCGKLRSRSKPRVPVEERLPPGQFTHGGVHCNKPGECTYSYDTVHRYYFVSRRQLVRASGEEAVAQAELSALQGMRWKHEKDDPEDKRRWPNHPSSLEIWPWTVEERVWWNKLNCDRNMWTREGERERRGH